MRHWLISLILAISSLAAAQTSIPGWPVTGGGSGSSGTNTVGSGPQNTWQVQTTSCGSNTNCTQIFGDGKAVLDVSTTLNSSTITCPNNDCNFVAGDVGKVAWVTAGGGNGGALTCPLSTIATVNSAQSITLTAASDCTGAALTATGALVWGHKDGATLAAMTPGCAAIYTPSNINIIFDQAFLITPPACATTGSTAATGIPQPSIYGQSSNVQFIMTPDFNWTSCTGNDGNVNQVCMFSGLSQAWEIGIWGTGVTSASDANCAGAGGGKIVMAMNPTAGAIYFVNVSGICTGQEGLVGAELNSPDEEWFEGGCQNVGATCINVTTKGHPVNTENLNGNNTFGGGQGLVVASGGMIEDYGTFPWAQVSISGTMTARNSHFCGGQAANSNAITVNSGGVFNEDGDLTNADCNIGTKNVGLLISAGGTVNARNTTYTATGGSNTAISNSGLFVDKGGNKVTGTPLVSLVPDTTSGDQVLFGSCTGTDTAAATIQFTNLGVGYPQNPTTATCTAAASATGPAMVRAGTLLGFTCASSAQGVNASDGVCTVLKNNVATALTCTIGNAAPTGNGRFYCVDNTHTVAYAIGDVITVQVVTQAATTLANQRVTLLAW